MESLRASCGGGVSRVRVAEPALIAVNWHIVEGRWKRLKGMVQMSWGGLCDSQGDMTAGRRLEQAGRAQMNYGLAKDAADRQLKRFRVRIREQDTKNLS